MAKEIYTRIIGTGSYLPPKIIKNSHFLDYKFYDPATNQVFDKSNEEIIQKFNTITNIEERRYVADDQVTSDIAALAIKDACQSAGITLESLDFIIIGHNFGDIYKGNVRSDILPGLANKVKMKLNITNPTSICHDIISGCPSWTQGMIVADAYIKSGFMKRGVVVGADVLSRISDPHDRDSMIYADGAGATLVEAVESDEPTGILAHSSRSDSVRYASLLTLGKSNNPDFEDDELFIKMVGHKLYIYAINTVPGTVKESIELAGLNLSDIKKVFIHQANEKMDEAILNGIFKLYHEKNIPEGIMPMSIRKLGNSSTATVPMLLDLVLKGKMEGQEVNAGDCTILCSVGAGMNINSIVYKW
ncbi:MAG: ketoacyl-ACP synthase III [Prolixibacteraceae bacterium]|jgi:3-oxoacyl-[acyl-carrier-protein] synthase III|nr:ketoacyl-ACP synthase III [Prolixibacteraceae bacterium]MBT6005081.1 ketoacyl-ACP synthase III [Prolixibacteraceae bacterium]MBT6766615.1 ketoacyl-ACP synthase III [Prolixibacteraceae bacterium]MBT6999346.1 ketoacyl-ACP synthase III [Prolixibacteraceae bacterium]MBT7395431.1 ketoacyl-ACP synthase III [Prolixibacteraceae bacterium]